VTSAELHAELCHWADVLVVAPLSANTLAKLANGIADNLLVCDFSCCFVVCCHLH